MLSSYLGTRRPSGHCPHSAHGYNSSGCQTARVGGVAGSRDRASASSRAVRPGHCTPRPRSSRLSVASQKSCANLPPYVCEMSGALLPSFSLFCPAIAQPLAEMLMQLVPIDVISQGDRRSLLHHCPGIAIRLTPSKPRKRSPGGDDCSRDRPVRSSEVATTSRMKRTSATFDRGPLGAVGQGGEADRILHAANDRGERCGELGTRSHAHHSGAQELRWVARPTTPAARGCFCHPVAIPGRAHGCLSGGAMGQRSTAR